MGVVASAMFVWRVWESPRSIHAGRDQTNVLLISLDTTRKDHLSCYGYERETTPHIDELAEESLLFTRCVAVSNWTLPTHASMLSGLYPTTHGAHWVTTDVPHVNSQNPAGLMSSSCHTLAEVLHATGYRTGAVVANAAYVSKKYQLDQGFEHYDDRPGEPPAPYRQAEEIADEALAWLQQKGERPFFLFLNFVDPHVPHNAPPPYCDRFRGPRSGKQVARSWKNQFWLDIRRRVLVDGLEVSPRLAALFHNRYDAEIAYMDAHIGRVLDWLRAQRLYDRTMVIVTADHGETFGEHRLMGHALGLYEPEVAVPMILKLPSSKQSRVLDHAVQHVDIMPTVLEVLQLPLGGAVEGVSMLKRQQRDVLIEEYVCLRNAGISPRFDRMQWALCRADLKLIEYSDGEFELFDLGNDPHELSDLAADREDHVRSLRSALRALRAELEPLPRDAPADASPDPDELLRLRDLGYIN